MSLGRLEKTLRQDGHSLIAGIDEVGRGALAGPLVSACVILPQNSKLSLTDSKLLLPSKRALIAKKIICHCLDFGIGLVSSEEIDQLNITESIRLSYLRSLVDLGCGFSRIIIDGNYDYLCDYNDVSLTQVKADKYSKVVSAASILAKVFRDNIMHDTDKVVPGYSFNKNVGYGTKDHIESIKLLGLSKLHRKSFVIKSLQ